MIEKSKKRQIISLRSKKTLKKEKEESNKVIKCNKNRKILTKNNLKRRKNKGIKV